MVRGIKLTKNYEESLIGGLRSGLHRLRDGFKFIGDREEKKRIEEFRKSFDGSDLGVRH